MKLGLRRHRAEPTEIIVNSGWWAKNALARVLCENHLCVSVSCWQGLSSLPGFYQPCEWDQGKFSQLLLGYGQAGEVKYSAQIFICFINVLMTVLEYFWCCQLEIWLHKQEYKCNESTTTINQMNITVCFFVPDLSSNLIRIQESFFWMIAPIRVFQMRLWAN